MRIVAGQWRGRSLTTPPGDTTRPTADRTRETLFNMLASRLGSFEELAVADLFAGSGALGLEALSRGAAHCLFAEQDSEAIKALRRNVETFGCSDRCRVHAGSVMKLGLATRPYDLLLLDPPYGSGAGAVAIDRLLRLGWIGPASWIALETGAGEEVGISRFEVAARRQVGRAALTFLRSCA